MVETVLALPLLAGLLWGSTLLIRAFQARLDLLALTREFAVFIARNEAPNEGPEAARRRTLRTLAGRLGMKPQAVDFKLEALPMPGLQASPGAWPGGLGFLAEAALGQRLTVEYRFKPAGPLGRLLGEGLLMRESLALKTDPWRHPAQHFLEKLWTR